ncbi:MAG: site-specific integrase [Alphaproteobacteria bacterium]|nr:site-specific integrase [Alphaproteobacteria bacterium]
MTYLHQFLEEMTASRKMTRSTLHAYEGDLRDFYHFFKDQPVENVAFPDIQNYLLTQKHLAPSTVARRLSSLRQFYTFLIANGKIKENPFSFVRMTPYKSKLAPLANPEDVTRLLEGAQGANSAEGKRLSVLLQILYISDMSVNDLVSLPLAVGLVVSKGRKKFLTFHKNNLIVPLTKAAHDSLQAYMKVRNHFLIRNQESPWLFPSSSQKGHLTRQRFGQLLKELSLKMKLDPVDNSLYNFRYNLRKNKELERNFGDD